jgi:hypothetical protein
LKQRLKPSLRTLVVRVEEDDGVAGGQPGPDQPCADLPQALRQAAMANLRIA